MKNFRVESSPDSQLTDFVYFDSEHVMHWKTRFEDNGTGVLHIQFRSHTGNPYLSLDCMEVPASGRGVKRTMGTLDVDASRALYEWLKALHEPEA